MRTNGFAGLLAPSAGGGGWVGAVNFDRLASRVSLFGHGGDGNGATLGPAASIQLVQFGDGGCSYTAATVVTPAAAEAG